MFLERSSVDDAVAKKFLGGSAGEREVRGKFTDIFDGGEGDTDQNERPFVPSR